MTVEVWWEFRRFTGCFRISREEARDAVAVCNNRCRFETDPSEVSCICSCTHLSMVDYISVTQSGTDLVFERSMQSHVRDYH